MEQVAILDCGGQYTKVIDRKVRELAVRTEIFPIGVAAASLRDYQGIILSGGPASVWGDQAPHYDPAIFDLGLPVLGICYGMQLLNHHFGGEVRPGRTTEYGETTIKIDPDCPLFAGLAPEQQVLMSHGDSVTKLAAGFAVGASSEQIAAAIYHKTKRLYGVQFHPEVDLTVSGKAILTNFLKGICGLKGDYILADRIETALAKIRAQVGTAKILVLVSGGVDSAVSAALLVKALDPEKVYAIHVDHGLMRQDESDLVCANLHQLGLKHLIRVDAKDKFFNSIVEVNGQKLGPLTELVDPEAKRNLIGEVFIQVVREAATELKLDFDQTFWAQGTLRPDLIESGNPDVSSYANRIKTHHNDVEIVRQARAKGLVVETNWDWHKDEVRQVARLLGIDEAIAGRQPFPGPGLAVRLLGNDGSERVSPERQQRYQQLLTELGGTQYQGTVVPLKTVGVQGDCRSYRYLGVLAGQGMEFDWEEVYRIGTNLPNQTDFINRVAYVLNQTKLDGALQTYPLYINDTTVNLLRAADHLVLKYLNRPGISQVFAVLLPLGISKKFSVAIRSFVTNDFMTGRPARIGPEISRETMADLVGEILQTLPQIELVLYDVTSKPPATVEWQ